MKKSNFKAKLLSLLMVFCMVLCMISSGVFAYGDEDEDMYLCECCDQWKPESEICDEDTVVHCLEYCENGAVHCCICEKFDPDKVCTEDPSPHCLDCC